VDILSQRIIITTVPSGTRRKAYPVIREEKKSINVNGLLADEQGEGKNVIGIGWVISIKPKE
jgi:hypothetical protein